ELSGASISIAAGTAPNFTSVVVDSSTLVIADSRSMANLTLRGDGRLTMQNDSALTITGTLNFEGGTITVGGGMIVPVAATSNFATSASKFIDGVFENRGTANFTAGTISFGRDGGNFSARIENAAGSVFIVDGDGDFSSIFSSPNYQ